MEMPSILALNLILMTIHWVQCQVIDGTFRDFYCQQCQSLCLMQQCAGPSEMARVGKAGPPGPSGPPGPAGTVDLTKVERMVAQKLNESKSD